MSGSIWNRWVWLMVISTGLLACKTKKAVVALPKTDTSIVLNNRKAENLALLKKNDLSFHTLSLRGKASLNINGNSNNVNMNIRMKKDEMIWVSVTAIAGIEVARVLITPDSIKVRNNFQSVYLKKPFDYVHAFTNKQVSFKLLQSVFSGNTIDDFMVEQSELEQLNGVWELKGQQQDLAYRVLFNTLLKVSENNLNDLKSGKALKVVYGDYQKVVDELFPSNMQISSMAGVKQFGVNVDFSKIERNLPLDFPFSVPKKYEVIN
jgi:hypothetical protein